MDVARASLGSDVFLLGGGNGDSWAAVDESLTWKDDFFFCDSPSYGER